MGKNLKQVSRLLSGLGYELEDHQQHISGHRSVLSPQKLLLIGKKRKNGLRVVIKMSDKSKGIKEIKKEKKIRDTLHYLHVSNGSRFLPKIPKTIDFGEDGTYTIIVTEFIPHDRIFVSYPLPKQLAWLIQTLNDREQLYSRLPNWTYKQKQVFTSLQTENYLKNFEKFISSIARNYPILSLKEAMEAAYQVLRENKSTLQNYEKYFIHSDFIPHNIRINSGNLYLLDCLAIQFGNKYEELARFLNYMSLHNPTLEEKMKAFVLKKRGKDEHLDLKLMRIYKAGFLLNFYAGLLPKASDYLLSLVVYRLDFWEEALRCILQDRALDKKTRKLFKRNDANLTSKQEIYRRKTYEGF